MNVFVRKEIRLLLPGFVSALLLSFSVWLIPLDTNPSSGIKVVVLIFPFLLCPAMLVITAVGSFGREVSWGTFAGLLSQPISRRRIWATKTALLAAALGIIFAAWWVSFLLHAPLGFTSPEVHDLAFGTSLFMLAVFASGQWTVLLFRDMVVAIWVTLILPGALATPVVGLTGKHPELTGPVLLAVFGIYIPVGVLLSRRLFLRAQDVSWTGGTISMPEVRGLWGWFGGRMSHRRWRPRAALFAKEFQLHQSLLMIAGVLALVHLTLRVTRPGGGGLHESSAFEFVAYHIWLLWPVMMPLLIGCAAVAEERKLGTLEAQLCLPVRRRTQFAIKFAVALGLVIFLGVLVPVLVEGGRILSDPDPKVESSSRYLFQWLLATFSLFGVSFCASTLVRNTLQAFAPAVLGILLAGSLAGSALWVGNATRLWNVGLLFLVGVPTLTLTLVELAYWNFKRVLVGWAVWRRNIFVLLAALVSVVVVTSSIYQRVWEFLTPMEPAHGPVRLGPAQAVTMRSDADNLIVQLPDGRIWTDRFVPTVQGLGARLTGDWRLTEFSAGGRFLEGSNWTSIAFWYRDVSAVQNDGSLWTVAQPDEYERYWRQPSASNSGPLRLVRLGAGNDWKSVADRLALKTDGTLWRLGGGRLNTRTNWPGFRAFEPVRLGVDSDWSELESSDWPSPIVIRKTDGRAWVNFVNPPDHKAEVLRFDEVTSITRSPLHDGQGWRGMAWLPFSQGNSCQVGVRKDGTFRVCGVWGLSAGKTSGPIELTKSDLQLGKESDWRAIAGDGHTIVTLKADGSLWQWDFLAHPAAKPEMVRATRLGTNSDWIALVGAYPGIPGIVSLAADGSLWHWRLSRQNSVPSEVSDIQPLLAASRKPQSIGNVFGKAE